jgi:hypothetical protein
MVVDPDLVDPATAGFVNVDSLHWHSRSSQCLKAPTKWNHAIAAPPVRCPIARAMFFVLAPTIMCTMPIVPKAA